MVFGAGTEIIDEDVLEVEEDEADEAEGGVEAGSGRFLPCTAENKRQNVNGRRIGLIATIIKSILRGRERKVERKNSRRGISGLLEAPISLGCCRTCGSRIGGTISSVFVHETYLPDAYCSNLMEGKGVEELRNDMPVYE